MIAYISIGLTVNGVLLVMVLKKLSVKIVSEMEMDAFRNESVFLANKLNENR